MKKTLAILLILCMVFAFCACKKEEAGIDVYVSISVKGELELSAETIRVTDLDGDGKYTLDEALKAAHKTAPNGEDSYASEEGQYGLCITKLWDDANGVSAYGYMINNVSAANLSAEIKEGDYVYAYSYKDTTYFSDVYTYFDKLTIDADGNEATIHLNKVGYDMTTWELVTESYAGANIYLNGGLLGQTDKDGNYAFSIAGSKNSTMVITAGDSTNIIVPAVCLAIGK